MILITGGAGYIGSHTALELMRAGKEVLVYDNLQKGHVEACTRIGAQLVTGDIRDTEKLAKLFKKHEIEGVIHFAAASLVGESMADPIQYYDNNVYGTSCLVREMIKAGVLGLVFSSTAAVYGEPEKTPILEEDKKKPSNPYGQTKLDIERMLSWAHEAHGLSFVTLRYFNAAGADQKVNIGEDHRPETHLIPIILQTALGKRPNIQIYGDDYPTPDGTCIRDYIHVTDLALAHIMSLEKLKRDQCATYNLGNGLGFSVREVIIAAEKVTGRSIAVIRGERRAGDPAVLLASPTKIKSELGWEPRYTAIESIIETAWRWHLSNPDGYVTI